MSGARLARLLTGSAEERELSSYVVLALLLAIVAIGLYFEFRRPSADSAGVARSLAFTDPWTVALWLLILPLTGALAIRALVRRPDFLRTDYAIFLFVAFNILSLAWAAHDARAQSLHWLGYMGVGMGLYFVAREYCATQSRALLLAGGMLTFLVVFSLINLLAWNWTPLSSIPSQLDGRGSRLMGATGSAAILSVTVAFLIVFCLLGLSRQSPRWLRALALAGGLLGAAVVAFGNTRSAIIGLGLAIIVALLVERRWSWLAGLGVLTIIAMLSPLGDRFLTGWRALLTGANPNAVPGLLNGIFRLELWSGAVKLLWHSWTPFVGDGIGTTVVGLPAIYHTHSEVVQVWLETGTIGLGLGIWIYISFARRMLAAHEALRGFARTTSLIGVCALALAIPNFAWFVMLDSQIGWLLMIACAISISASDWGQKAVGEHESVSDPPATDLIHPGSRARLTSNRTTSEGNVPPDIAAGELALKRRTAARAIMVLIAIVVGIQPISVIAGQYYLPRLSVLQEGSATYTQWVAYTSGLAPDVLFIGDSRAATDIDPALLGHELSQRAGRSVTVGKIGINGADAGVLEALTYRVMARASRPKMVVYALTEFALNENYQRDFTPDYWQLASPPDLGFTTLALRLDPYRERFVRGLVVPAFANYPIVGKGVYCQFAEIRNPTACNPAPAQTDRITFLKHYRDFYLHDYHYSMREQGDTTDAMAMVRAKNVRFTFIVFPVEGLDDVSPDTYSTFLSRVTNLGTVQHVPFLDVHRLMADEPAVWDDPLHLNSEGVRRLAPQLADRLSLA